MVEPDHAFVSHERWAAAPAPEPGRFPRVVPELIVEVMSGRTATRDRGEKKAIYERNGVLEYWLVDPRAREVTVFHAVDGRFDAGCVYAVNDRLPSQVLAELTIDVLDLMPLP